MTVAWRGRHQGLLGTVIETRVDAVDEPIAIAGEEALVAELERLQSIFNRFDPGSDLRRWEVGLAEPPPELVAVLSLAAAWHESSGGAFNPLVGRLTEVWSAASERDAPPAPDEIARVVEEVARLPFRVVGDRVEVGGDLTGIDLNAIAKGWIVDAAADAVLGADGVDGVLVNAGGDLSNRTREAITVGIEDPARPYDNVPPLTRVSLPAGASLATSGGSRRYRTIAGVRHSHVLDPRTGRSADGVAAATVIAPSAHVADVVATILTVLGPPDGAAFVDGLGEGVRCLVVAPDGAIVTGGDWTSIT